MSPKQPVRILASTSASRIIAQEYSRRRFLSFAAATAGAGLLAACSSPGAEPAPGATGGALETTSPSIPGATTTTLRC